MVSAVHHWVHPLTVIKVQVKHTEVRATILNDEGLLILLSKCSWKHSVKTFTFVPEYFFFPNCYVHPVYRAAPSLVWGCWGLLTVCKQITDIRQLLLPPVHHYCISISFRYWTAWETVLASVALLWLADFSLHDLHDLNGCRKEAMDPLRINLTTNLSWSRLVWCYVTAACSDSGCRPNVRP